MSEEEEDEVGDKKRKESGDIEQFSCEKVGGGRWSS